MGMVIYRGGLFVYIKSCYMNLKYKMDLKVDVFEKNWRNIYSCRW